MFGKKKAKSNSKDEGSSLYSLRVERNKKSSQPNNYSAEVLCKYSSSSESLNVSFQKKGLSLDRSSFDIEPKSQVKPKRSSWFLRDRNRDKKLKNEKFFKRASLDFTVTYDAKPKPVEKPPNKHKTIQRQNAADYTGDSSTVSQEEIREPKKSGLKRFLKGDIGIKSFNYYLLKEGLKKNQSKAKQETFKSKSEENIYEEIYFRNDRLPTPKPRSPPALPPSNKQTSFLMPQKMPSDIENSKNCEICLQEAQECSLKNCDKSRNHQLQNRKFGSLSGSEGYAQVPKRTTQQSYDFFQQKSESILQFQSYNPSNPSVYKIESTPVALDYSPMEGQIYQIEFNKHYAQAQQNLDDVQKSSSSSDSIDIHNQSKRPQQIQQQANQFYTRPNFFYQSSNKHSRKDQENLLCKADSSNSIHSENSLNNSRNSSKKSVNSNQYRDKTQDMSDSSLGDSLFSSDANKRYFGSSESCRFNYECRSRCSLEKCSFSDTCRYECDVRNCDCSSSYFSSDFDETNNYNACNTNHMKKSHQTSDYLKSSNETYQYAEDFIKHVSNVKRRSQNIPFDSTNELINSQLIYEVPKIITKRLDMDAIHNDNVSNKIKVDCVDELIRDTKKIAQSDNSNHLGNFTKATGTSSKFSSSISSNESKKKTSGENHNIENKQNCLNLSQPDISESLPKARILGVENKLWSDKICSREHLAASSDKITETKIIEAENVEKNMQQKYIDDDDDVFLENHEIKEAETKNVSSRTFKIITVQGFIFAIFKGGLKILSQNEAVICQ